MEIYSLLSNLLKSPGSTCAQLQFHSVHNGVIVTILTFPLKVPQYREFSVQILVYVVEESFSKLDVLCSVLQLDAVLAAFHFHGNPHHYAVTTLIRAVKGLYYLLRPCLALPQDPVFSKSLTNGTRNRKIRRRVGRGRSLGAVVRAMDRLHTFNFRPPGLDLWAPLKLI